MCTARPLRILSRDDLHIWLKLTGRTRRKAQGFLWSSGVADGPGARPDAEPTGETEKTHLA